MRNSVLLPVWGVLAISVAACGHGSGSSGGFGGVIAIPAAFQAANTTTAPPFGSASAPGTFTIGTGFSTAGVTPAPANSLGGATVTLTTDTNGNLTQLVVSAPLGGGGTFNQTFSAGQLQSFTAPISLSTLVATVQQLQSRAVGQVSYIFQGTGSGLNVSSYGAWLQSNGGGSFKIGMLGFGNETTPAQMAALVGSATYNGSTFGVGATGAIPFAFTGAAQVVANFPAGAVTATFSGLSTQNISGGGAAIVLPTISGGGTIGLGVNANQYAFALAGAGGFTGNVTGTFYGTTAQETTGVWQAVNASVPATTLTGTFGAHR